MLVGEILEIIPDNPDCIFGLLRPAIPLLHLKLDEKAFLQVSGADTVRLEFLNNPQQAQNLFTVSLYGSLECKVIDNRLDVPAEVSVLIQASDQKRRYLVLPV